MSYGVTRYGVQDGKRYVARDFWGEGKPFPEHAVWINGDVRWLPHPEGGTMTAFAGPDEVYAELTQGGHETWGEAA